jgi:hypothetical protein
METDIKSLNIPNPFSQVFPDCTSHPSSLFITDNRLISSDLTSDQIKKLKGTGKNGMLTKGDVLKAMGKIKSAYGSAEKMYNDPLGPSGKRASEVGSFPSSPLSSFFLLHSLCSPLPIHPRLIPHVKRRSLYSHVEEVTLTHSLPQLHLLHPRRKPH